MQLLHWQKRQEPERLLYKTVGNREDETMEIVLAESAGF